MIVLFEIAILLAILLVVVLIAVHYNHHAELKQKIKEELGLASKKFHRRKGSLTGTYLTIVVYTNKGTAPLFEAILIKKLIELGATIKYINDTTRERIKASDTSTVEPGTILLNGLYSQDTVVGRLKTRTTTYSLNFKLVDSENTIIFSNQRTLHSEEALAMRVVAKIGRVISKNRRP